MQVVILLFKKWLSRQPLIEVIRLSVIALGWNLEMLRIAHIGLD